MATTSAGNTTDDESSDTSTYPHGGKEDVDNNVISTDALDQDPDWQNPGTGGGGGTAALGPIARDAEKGQEPGSTFEARRPRASTSEGPLEPVTTAVDGPPGQTLNAQNDRRVDETLAGADSKLTSGGPSTTNAKHVE